jgi:hypothetical protein
VKKMHGDTRAMGRGADGGGMPKRNTRWYLLFERQGGRKGAAVVQLNPNAYWRVGGKCVRSRFGKFTAQGLRVGLKMEITAHCKITFGSLYSRYGGGCGKGLDDVEQRQVDARWAA